MFSRESFAYTAYFCEENTYKLIEKLCSDGIPQENVYAVFVSNPEKEIVLCSSRVGHGSHRIVQWDYHVFTCIVNDDRVHVLDFDTNLGFYVPFENFASRSMYLSGKPRFWRIISANNFLNNFSSTREHMRDKDGTWMQPPPPYPCIKGKTAKTDNELMSFLDMTADRLLCEEDIKELSLEDKLKGIVLDDEQYIKFFQNKNLWVDTNE